MATLAALMEAARKWGGLPPQPKLAEGGGAYDPAYLLELQSWEQALAGVADEQLRAAWEASRDAWDWSKRAMPPWHLQRVAQRFQKPAPRQLAAPDEEAVWVTAREQVAALPAAEFDALMAQVLIVARERIGERVDTFWSEEVRREHVIGVLERRVVETGAVS